MDENIRIQKFLSQKGIFSRRETEKFIREKRIKVNGEIIKLGKKVSEKDIISIDGETIEIKKRIKKIVIAFYKPRGIESTLKKLIDSKTLADFDFKVRVFPIGRLDKDSQGLLLLTNDGDLANKLAHPRYQKEKEYLVAVDKKITKAFLLKMEKGVFIDKYKTKNCELEQIESKIFKIIMKEGRNRQIRKMCKILGYEVKDLLRIRVGSCKLGELKKGKFRILSKKEIKSLTSF